MIVVADATPLRYLLLIESVHILPGLYGRVFLPTAVFRELTQVHTPGLVREWVLHRPDWVEIRTPIQVSPLSPSILGEGEREAIALAEELAADVLLVDDWAARREAERRNIAVQGTLGLLSLASQRGLIDIVEAIRRLRNTNFRASEKLIRYILDREKDSEEGSGGN